jgi:hypothetical protein
MPADDWPDPAVRGFAGPHGSHPAMYDDQETYFAGLTGFLTSLPPTRT